LDGNSDEFSAPRAPSASDGPSDH
jgi:hypothetical protein